GRLDRAHRPRPALPGDRGLAAPRRRADRPRRLDLPPSGHRDGPLARGLPHPARRRAPSGPVQRDHRPRHADPQALVRDGAADGEALRPGRPRHAGGRHPGAALAVELGRRSGRALPRQAPLPRLRPGVPARLRHARDAAPRRGRAARLRPRGRVPDLPHHSARPRARPAGARRTRRLRVRGGFERDAAPRARRPAAALSRRARAGRPPVSVRAARGDGGRGARARARSRSGEAGITRLARRYTLHIMALARAHPGGPMRKTMMLAAIVLLLPAAPVRAAGDAGSPAPPRVATNPDYETGKKAVESHDYKAALESFNRALAKEPDS